MTKAAEEALPLRRAPLLTPSAPRAPSLRRRRVLLAVAPSLFLGLLSFSAFLLFSQPARAVQVIAASSLEACANDGQVKKWFYFFGRKKSQKREKKKGRVPAQKKKKKKLSLLKFDAALNCSQKLVVTLAVESGAALATTSLDFDVSCVLVKNGSSGTVSPPSTSPTPCPCPCRYGADAGCLCQNLASPLRVSVTKTPTYATYPLSYLQPFNYGAREAIIRTGTGWPSLACDAGSLSASPTCGWATAGSGLLVGDRIPDSQGFCCDCSLDQLGSGTLGGGSTQGEREELVVFW